MAATSKPSQIYQKHVAANTRQQARSLSKEAAGIPPTPIAVKKADGPQPPTVYYWYYWWSTGYYTIMPEGNRFLDVWDCFVITALMLTGVILPYEVLLLESPPFGLYVVDEIINTIFICDIVLTFNVAFMPESTAKVQDSFEQYVKEPRTIAAHYMAFPFSQNLTAGWFWPDVITVIPWDRLPFVTNASSVRMIRVLRLVRMIRLARVIKLFKRWQTYSGMPYSAVKMMKCALATLLLVHWLACCWARLGLPSQRGQTTWMSRYTMKEDVGELSVMTIYWHALYLNTVVLTSVGFGDIVPANNHEVVAVIGTIFLLCLEWAWVIANVVDVITNLDHFTARFSHVMDDLNSIMATSGCENALRQSVRRHINESRGAQRKRHFRQATLWISPNLRGELAFESGVDHAIGCIWYFKGLSEEVTTLLADEFLASVFSPGEIITDQQSVMVVIKGTMMKRGQLFGRDTVIGEDVILMSDWLRETTLPRTISFLEVLALHRDKIVEAAKKHPDFDVRLRRAQIKLAIWRSFVQESKKKAKKRYMTDKNGRRSTWEHRFFLGDVRSESKRKESNADYASWSDSFCHEISYRDMMRKAAIQAVSAETKGLDASTDKVERSIDEYEVRIAARLANAEQQLGNIAADMSSLLTGVRALSSAAQSRVSV